MIRDTYDDSKILEQATEALRDAPVPPGPPAEVLATVSLLDGRVQAGGAAPPLRIRTRRFPMKRLLSIAAAVVLFAGLGVLAYHLFGGGTSVAFAEVRRQIEQANTMKCHIHMQLKMPQQAGDNIEVVWYYKTPGLMRQEAVVSKTGEKAINTINFEAGKMLSLMPATKQAMVVDMGQLPQAVREKQVDFMAQMKKMVQGDSQELGFKKFDGQRLKGFRVIQAGQTMDIWVDPKTGTPVAMEMTLPDIGGMRMDGFVLGEEMDDALFSIVPPADYKVMYASMPLGNPTEADLAAGLKFLAELNDNTFPETLAPSGKMIERLQDREKENKKKYEGLSDQEKMQRAMETTGPMVRMMMYTQLVKDFRYVGSGVKLGDGDRIVCRFKPKDGARERIVYGDLRIEDAPAEETHPSPAAE